MEKRQPSSSNGKQRNDPGGDPTRFRRLLIVERDPLLRWSLSAYLGRWFEVVTPETSVEALRYARSIAFDAVVLSDVLAEPGSGEIVSAARHRNPGVHIVSLVTRIGEEIDQAVDQLEKPFQLARLAGLLGVAVK